ncbi:type II secretion system protein [Aeromicrobium sp.]|uniref:type II secretion system F family protein n=1 Tax=Aeromicrobium sp. TaxID=1871063 RepID=UPI0025BA3D31|nr:type II secretion system protein [Aeromicrobium sp.]MCK5891541.1 type II secretion system protein [Aeromicrobium sp.]
MIALPFSTWAAVATGCTVLLARPDPGWVAAHRLRVAAPVRWPARLLLAVGVPAVATLPPLVHGAAALVVVATACGVAVFARRELRRGRQREQVRAAVREVTELVDALAAEMRAGVLPHRALNTVAVDHPLLAPAAQVAGLGGDTSDALRAAAGGPGRSGLDALAGAWHVSETCGAPLAEVLDRVARALRFETELGEEVRSTVEPARATGRLLAVLPLLGLFLGAGLGADPVHVVTATLPGALSLAAGTALACAGVRWIETTADRAERG